MFMCAERSKKNFVNTFYLKKNYKFKIYIKKYINYIKFVLFEFH